MYTVDRKTESKNIGNVKVVQFRGHLIALGNGSELKVWPTYELLLHSRHSQERST